MILFLPHELKFKEREKLIRLKIRLSITKRQKVFLRDGTVGWKLNHSRGFTTQNHRQGRAVR